MLSIIQSAAANILYVSLAQILVIKQYQLCLTLIMLPGHSSYKVKSQEIQRKVIKLICFLRLKSKEYFTLLLKSSFDGKCSFVMQIDYLKEKTKNRKKQKNKLFLGILSSITQIDSQSNQQLIRVYCLDLIRSFSSFLDIFSFKPFYSIQLPFIQSQGRQTLFFAIIPYGSRQASQTNQKDFVFSSILFLKHHHLQSKDLIFNQLTKFHSQRTFFQLVLTNGPKNQVY